MKFETILDAYVAANYAWAEGYINTHRRLRQRDAFRARLVKMYEELNYRKNWYRMGRDPLP